MRAWLLIQLRLLACAPRLIAALVTGNDDAFENVAADIDALHEEWHR